VYLSNRCTKWKFFKCVVDIAKKKQQNNSSASQYFQKNIQSNSSCKKPAVAGSELLKGKKKMSLDKRMTANLDDNLAHVQKLQLSRSGGNCNLFKKNIHLWLWTMFFLEQFNYANFIRSAFSTKKYCICVR
jgi:hypothetical protein